MQDDRSNSFIEFMTRDGTENPGRLFRDIELRHRKDARQIVPWRIRDKARIVKLEKFGPRQQNHE